MGEREKITTKSKKKNVDRVRSSTQYDHTHKFFPDHYIIKPECPHNSFLVLVVV